jgi:hypothetical protein
MPPSITQESVPIFAPPAACAAEAEIAKPAAIASTFTEFFMTFPFLES